MLVDWSYVKKATLWHYDPLIKKIKQVLGYQFVQQHYLHTMGEAAQYSLRLQQGYLQNGQPVGWLREIADHFTALGHLGIRDYQELIERVDTQTRCETYIRETSFSFRALIDVLGYLLRWALPFRCLLKELVDVDNQSELLSWEALTAHKIKSNLDMLETCCTVVGRRRMANEKGIDEALLLDLTHRADMTRLAYVRGKTVMHLCGAGYDSLAKLAAADLKKMEAEMSAYYQTLGKTLADFKAVIPLDWMVGGAKVLPKVMEP